MKFVLELLTAVVWQQQEISNFAMLIVPVVVQIYFEHCFDEMSHLFIVQIWHYTSVGAAGYFMLLKVPVVNDDYKEHCFCATEKVVREAKWNAIECTPLSWTKGKEVEMVVVIRLLLLGVDDWSIFWVIHPPANHAVFSSNGFKVNKTPLSLNWF